MHPLTGRKQSPEHIANRTAAWHLSPAREKARQRFSELNKARTGTPRSPEATEKQRAKIMGRATEWLKGKKQSAERRAKQRALYADKTKHPRYIDGRNESNQSARSTTAYKEWRRAVFVRDDFTCTCCAARGVRLEADHLKGWAAFPDLRFDVSNGRTLCGPCHRATDNFGWRARPEPQRDSARA